MDHDTIYNGAMADVMYSVHTPKPKTKMMSVKRGELSKRLGRRNQNE